MTNRHSAFLSISGFAPLLEQRLVASKDIEMMRNKFQARVKIFRTLQLELMYVYYCTSLQQHNNNIIL